VSGEDDWRADVARELGMSWAEIEWFGSREEFERQQYAKDRGHCCAAGMTAAPGPCVWHPVETPA
jgi:hypothetical protein